MGSGNVNHRKDTTTVGYGNQEPVTFFGRIVAVILMITGVGFFGAIAANLAAFFVRKDEDEKIDKLQRDINSINEKLTQFHMDIAASIQKVTEDIMIKLSMPDTFEHFDYNFKLKFAPDDPLYKKEHDFDFPKN